MMVEQGKPGRKTMEELMSRYRAKLHSVLDAVWTHRDAATGRMVAEGFVDKPSPKLFFDYASVIASPIDLRTIRGNIETDRYESSTELGADLELMLSNAREYNEEDAGIVADASTLEPLIHRALKALGPMPLTSPRVLKDRYGYTPASSPSPACCFLSASPPCCLCRSRGDESGLWSCSGTAAGRKYVAFAFIWLSESSPRLTACPNLIVVC